MKRAFISYSRQNTAFAERLARDLGDAGFDVWIDFRNIQGGNVWRDAIFDGITQSDLIIVCLSPASVQSEWVRREILMARSQHKFIFPILISKCFDLMENYEETRFLLDIQSINFEKFGYEKSFPLLLNALQGNSNAKVVPANEQIDPQNITNPFKGLEAFQQTDAHLFFGRENLVEKLLARLNNQHKTHFLAVVGASGSGKSSLVRAGLIPAIRSGKITGSETWTPVIFTPGVHPIETLATRLLPLISGNRLLPEIVKILEGGKNSLYLLTEGIAVDTPSVTRIVFVIDQFEEIFTQAEQSEAYLFLELICTAVSHAESRVLVVATLRADFFGGLSRYPDLAALFEQDNMVIVTEMTTENLRQSIEGPTREVGLVYDKGLTDRILDDVRQQPGTLPLLQYALKELYERRSGRILTLNAYEQIGGVQQALARHADDIYDNLSASQQNILRRVLLRLVNIDDVGNTSRRRVIRNELVLRNVPNEAVQTVIDLLAGAQSRLLIVSRNIAREANPNGEGEAEPIVWVEISHEALIREWKRFADWIMKDLEALRYGAELSRLAQEWEHAEHHSDYLLTGKRLEQAEVWLTDADANNLQREFIEASLKIKKQQEVRQQTLRRIGLIFAGAFFSIAAYIYITFRSEEIFNSQRISRSLAIGIIWGLLIALLVIFTDVIPRQRILYRWQRLLFCAPIGIFLGTLAWGVFTWFFLEIPPVWEFMLIGGVGLALGFIANAVFKLPGWAAFLITAVCTYVPIYLLFELYAYGVQIVPLPLSKDLLNNPVSLLYFDYPEQIFTFGIPFAIIIGLVGHGEALLNDLKRLTHPINKVLHKK